MVRGVSSEAEVVQQHEGKAATVTGLAGGGKLAEMSADQLTRKQTGKTSSLVNDYVKPSSMVIEFPHGSHDDKDTASKYPKHIGNSRYLWNGKMMIGPDPKMVFLSSLSIVVPSLICDGFTIPWMWRNWSVIGWLAIVLIVGLEISSIYLFVRTAFSDPGIIAREKDPTVAYDVLTHSIRKKPIPRHQDAVVHGHLMKLKYCVTCRFYRPPRCVHCSLCDNCVDKFDHHCPWIGNCVGRRNYRSFVILLVSTSCLLVTVLICSFVKFVEVVVDTTEEVGSASAAFKYIWGDAWDSAVLVVFSLGISWFVIGLGAYHLYLISSNQTTYEQIKCFFDNETMNPWNRGLVHNFKEVLAHRRIPRLAFPPKGPTVFDVLALPEHSKPYVGPPALMNQLILAQNLDDRKSASIDPRSQMDFRNATVHEAVPRRDPPNSSSNICQSSDEGIESSGTKLTMVESNSQYMLNYSTPLSPIPDSPSSFTVEETGTMHRIPVKMLESLTSLKPMAEPQKNLILTDFGEHSSSQLSVPHGRARLYGFIHKPGGRNESGSVTSSSVSSGMARSFEESEEEEDNNNFSCSASSSDVCPVTPSSEEVDAKIGRIDEESRDDATLGDDDDECDDMSICDRWIIPPLTRHIASARCVSCLCEVCECRQTDLHSILSSRTSECTSGHVIMMHSADHDNQPPSTSRYHHNASSGSSSSSLLLSKMMTQSSRDNSIVSMLKPLGSIGRLLSRTEVGKWTCVLPVDDDVGALDHPTTSSTSSEDETLM